ncbi:MAG: dipeptide/oligopeptide/nickel ABC transporter ATP-binding protein [Pyramidobacter sp.]|nr:dipeptide/oligopeptide/nickel ABC transporter ATP-binding protein [Pyramidobacter sp.]
MKILEARDLSVTFRSKNGSVHRAVDSLSLSIEAGETLAVVGESGSGKTTLMRALLGLVESSGSVSLFGQQLERLTPDELARVRRRCGYVPQDPYGALPPGLTALSAVMEPEIIARTGRSRAQMRERAVQLLAELGLEGDRILSSRAVGLSGGQRQRVELARALMLDPQLLLCDEPTSMQDASTRGEIIDILRRRTQRGMAMIFVTHDLRLAAQAARRIVVMHRGRVCEQGSSSEVLSCPKDAYTQELIAAIPVLPVPAP